MKTITRNMTGRTGRAVANQFIIETPEYRVFQSYKTAIAQIHRQTGKVTLDGDCWDYSVTTGKYRNRFLNETKKETEAKIKSGEYELADLN